MVIKKTVLIVVFILMIFAGWIFLTGKTIETTLLDETFYKQVLEETDGDNLKKYFLETALAELKSYSFWDESMIYKALVHAAEEAWLKEQIIIFIEEYLAFIKGEQEELIVIIDLSVRRAIFIEDLKGQLERHFPELSETISPEITDELLSRLEIPSELSLIEIEDRTELAPGFKAEIARLEKIRSFLQVAPWLCIAALSLVCCLWFKLAELLKIFGAATLLSGVTFMQLWPLGWERYVAPYIDSLFKNYPLLVVIWAEEADIVLDILESVINQLALNVAGAGLFLFLIGIAGGGRGFLIKRKSKCNSLHLE